MRSSLIRFKAMGAALSGALFISLIVCSGCGGESDAVAQEPTMPMQPSGSPSVNPVDPAQALKVLAQHGITAPDGGVPVSVTADPLMDVRNEAKSALFSARPNPFALLDVEKKAANARNARKVAALFSQSFDFYYRPPSRMVEIANIAEDAPVPAMRLSGVVQGDGIIALIEMPDGRAYDIRPGTRVPGSEWTVVSIDSEKAVLRRAPARRPSEVVVKLQGKALTAPGSPGTMPGPGATPGSGYPAPVPAPGLDEGERF